MNFSKNKFDDAFREFEEYIYEEETHHMGQTNRTNLSEITKKSMVVYHSDKSL